MADLLAAARAALDVLADSIRRSDGTDSCDICGAAAPEGVRIDHAADCAYGMLCAAIDETEGQ